MMSPDHVAARTASVSANPLPHVFIVDDDVSVRESLEVLVADAGWCPEVFSSATDFMARPPVSCPSCLVLDVHLPDLSGLELQQQIADRRTEMPIIFITGEGDVPTSVRAMKAGAVEFLTKPFAPESLTAAIRGGLERSRAALEDRATLQVLLDRHRSLSRRENEVMALVVRGHLNKQVGGLLGISEITVKAHRGRVMRKMRAKSLPVLVNFATRLGLCAGDKG